MTTRALQIECLLDPVIDGSTGAVASGYTVYFYAAGTSTAKNVWTEKEKTNPYTYRTLGSDGTVQVYGDGVYKIVVKDTDGDTVHEWDNIKVRAANYQVVQKSGTYTATPDDDVILVDTDGGSITLNLQTVANFEYPLVVKNIGSNQVTIDPYSTQTIDSASTLTLSANAHVTLYPDTTSTIWRRTVGITVLEDADGDTKVQVEESSDEDIVRVDIGGTEQLTIQDGKIEPTTDNDIDLGASAKEFKDLYIDGTAYVDTLQTSTINEHAADSGVTIDSLNIKDGKLTTANSVVEGNITASAVTTDKIAASNVTNAKMAADSVDPSKAYIGTLQILSLPYGVKEWNSDVTSYTTVSNFYFTCPSNPTGIGGIVRIHGDAGGGSVSVRILVNGALASGAATRNSTGTYTWTSFSSTADVSSLTPSTGYDIAIQLYTDNASYPCYLDGVSLWWT